MAGQGDVINIVTEGNYGSSESNWSVVNDYRITAINNAGSLQAWLTTVAASLVAAWVSDLLSIMDDDFAVTGFRAFNRNDLTEEASVTASVDGTGATDGMPLRMAAVILKETGFRGRSYAGRSAFPALISAAADLGVLSAANVALLAAYAQAVRIAGDATNQGHLSVYSRTLSTPDVVFSTLVTGFTVRGTLGSVRLRQPVSE